MRREEGGGRGERSMGERERTEREGAREERGGGGVEKKSEMSRKEKGDNEKNACFLI